MRRATRVSVALCTRDGGEFVGEQLASILSQTEPVAQIVLSDDDSSDDTVAIVERAVAAAPAASRPELLVLRNDVPLGVAANFEQAARACTGELIAFCDQDDVWHSQKIRTLVGAFDDAAVLLAFSDARLVDAAGAPLGSTMFGSLRVSARERRLLAEGRAFEALLGRNLVTGATTMISRRLLDVAVPFPGTWVHDEWLAAIAAATGRLVAVDQPLIDYRQHGSNEIGAVQAGVAATVTRALRPLSEQLARVVPRAESLVAALEHLDELHPGALDAAQGKLAFERARSRFPHVRVARVPRVLAAVVCGDYRRYGRGLPDAARDLLRPY